MAFEKIFEFHEDTPEAVRQVLRKCYHHRNLVRLQAGDVKTGEVWLEEYDVVGRIGRSTGQMKVPLLIEQLVPARGVLGELEEDAGGPQLLDHCILRIVDVATGQELYRHPKYQVPVLEVMAVLRSSLKGEQDERYVAGYRWDVWRYPSLEADLADKTPQASFKTYEEATEYVAFVQGHKTHRALRTKDEWLEEARAALEDGE